MGSRLQTAESTCSAAASPDSAKILATLESERELTENVQAYGLNTSESFANYDRNTSSWKMSQRSLFGGWAEFSEIWPRAGMMRSGECFLPENSVRSTCETAFLSLPIPTVNGNYNRKGASATSGDGFITALKRGLSIPTIGKNEYKGSSKARFRGSASFRGAKMSEGLRTCEDDPTYLNPSFAEVVMGFPIGWTELEPLGMPLSLKSQNGSEKESSKPYTKYQGCTCMVQGECGFCKS